jgi:putative endonuclease
MSKQPCVYILASNRNSTLYVGVTSDLTKRVWEHKNDLVHGFTKRYGVHDFVDHWTACEILCEGKRAPEMRRRLQKHYSLRERGDVDRLFGFKTLERWRHELFHRGIYPKFKPEVGRYMQMMFLDLLRHELNLGGPGYMQIFLRSPGYDLSELGIAKADEVIKE